MPDPSDLAATLRRLAEETGMGEPGDEPWTFNHRGQVFGRGVRISDGLDNEDADFLVWCRNNAPAVASALERGAAAEALVEAHEIDAMVLHRGGPSDALVSARAAYDALKEKTDG